MFQSCRFRGGGYSPSVSFCVICTAATRTAALTIAAAARNAGGTTAENEEFIDWVITASAKSSPVAVLLIFAIRSALARTAEQQAQCGVWLRRLSMSASKGSG